MQNTLDTQSRWLVSGCRHALRPSAVRVGRRSRARRPFPMSDPILITGASGLIGTALIRRLGECDTAVRSFDLKDGFDVCDRTALADAVNGCCGIVHLGAVSRVVWGEQQPQLCRATNAEGTRNVLKAAQAAGCPWVLMGSSREVYGQLEHRPATEDTPLRPVNVYGRSKVAGETLMAEARAWGLRTAVVRLSNVYGHVADHPDRVVPAFIRSAVRGEPLSVEGLGHAFDFSYIDDVARGLSALIERIDGGETLPPIHLVTGVSVTLGELARMVVDLADSASAIAEAPPRGFDVSHFYGDPSRAQELLDWRAEVPLSEGLKRLINDFREQLQP